VRSGANVLGPSRRHLEVILTESVSTRLMASNLTGAGPQHSLSDHPGRSANGDLSKKNHGGRCAGENFLELKDPPSTRMSPISSMRFAGEVNARRSGRRVGTEAKKT